MIDFSACSNEFLGLLFHANTERGLFVELFLCRILADVLSDLHGTEVWATHGTEVRQLRAFLRQSFVVVFARDFRVEREIELIVPAEFKTRFRESVVPILGAGMAFG